MTPALTSASENHDLSTKRHTALSPRVGMKCPEKGEVV